LVGLLAVVAAAIITRHTAPGTKVMGEQPRWGEQLETVINAAEFTIHDPVLRPWRFWPFCAWHTRCSSEQEAEFWRQVTPEEAEETGVHWFESHHYAAALDQLRHAATMGRAKAQFYLGRMYREGHGVPKDDAEAAKWFQKAVRRGYVPAYDELGRLFRTGTGVQKNPSEAVKLFRTGAERGDAEAQAHLGNCIEFGEGVKQMEQESWHRRSFEQPTYSVTDPATCEEAKVWYRRSAEQGCANGELCLGELLGRSAADMLMARTSAGVFGFGPSSGLEREYSIEADKWHLLAQRQGLVWDHQRDFPLYNTNSWKTYSRQQQEDWAEAARRADAFVPRKEQPSEAARDSASPDPLEGPLSSGSGFLISEDGYLLTNFHVIEDAMNIVVRRGRESYPAALVKVDQVNDLALLKIAGHFRALPIAPSRASKLGDSVFTVGFPNPRLQGTEPKFTDGKISSLAGIQDDPRDFQISVAVQPGNSGGALVDSLGNAVGVVTARLSEKAALETTGALPQNVNYAVKSSYVLAFLGPVSELSGRLEKPWPAKERKFGDAVEEARNAAVLVLVY